MACSDRSGRWKVALVGRRLTDNENLGLSYLAAALDEAGFGYERFVLNQADDVGRVGDAILRGGFDLVGLSIPDGGSAYLPLAFGELLQRRGYRSPITCGGSFATLARHWLLERYPWLHSVVRFAGEVPLVQLAQALRDGRDVGSVAGLTTRAGDGLPAPVLDNRPLLLRPLRGELPEILGHQAAHILATRGCAGRCGYCAPAALQMQEQKEGIRAGVRIEVLREAGVGHVRRRPVEDLCDEMAFLWREQGVRYFYFVDEHMLPYEEDEALAFLDQMRRGLRRRKVGRLGIGTMLRADRLTPKVIRAFAELGLVRAFVGIELPSADEGRRYGRTFDPEHAREILVACEAAGVAVVSHVMMVHPESTRETIAGAIRFLETVPTGVFEVTEMRVYHGTTLWQRMAKEERLAGNPLRYAYTFRDPLVERFSQIFMRLRGESFWNHSIAYRTHDAFLAYALGKRLRPELGLGAIASEMNALRNQVIAVYADAYWKALALAESGMGGVDATALVVQARGESVRLQERLDEAIQDLAHQLHTSPQIFSPSRAAATGAIAFTFLGGTLAGCDSKTQARDGAGADTPGEIRDAASDPASESNCTTAMQDEQMQRYREAAAQAASCFSGSVSFLAEKVEVQATSSALGNYNGDTCAALLGARAGFDATEAQEQSQVESAIAGLDHSCLTSPSSTSGLSLTFTFDLSGGADKQSAQIQSALDDCTGGNINPNITVTITIDANGRVVETSGLTSEISSCLLKALDGLVFPCLAGSMICQRETVYIE